MTVGYVVTHAKRGDDTTTIACDFDSRNRLAAVLRESSGQLSVEIGGKRHRAPWNGLKRVRWLAQDEVMLFPISDSSQGGSYVGGLSEGNASVINVGRPLDVFTDRGTVACVYPEDQFTGRNDGGYESDLIAIFSCDTWRKIASFIVPYSNQYRDVPFLEVEHGTLDGNRKAFWFVAYKTDLLWKFAFDRTSVTTCNLGCRREDVIAITCGDMDSSIIVRHDETIVVRRYADDGTRLRFESESPIDCSDDARRMILAASLAGPGAITGYTANRFSFVADDAAVLMAF